MTKMLRNSFLNILFACLSFQYAGCALATQASLNANVEKTLNAKSLKGAQVGIVVKSLKTNKTIFSENADSGLNPASNVKLITTLAALHILKPEHKFKTEYLENGEDLIVKGYGDPSITTERLGAVAHQLKLRGITRISGDLVLDESFFDSQNVAKGYDKEKNNQKAWAAPMSALSLNRNAYEIFIRPTTVGKPAFVSVEPSSSYFSTKGQIKTTRKGFSPGISSMVKNGHMEVILSGNVANNVDAKSFYRRVSNPALYFGETLKALLAKEGVEIRGRVVMAESPKTARLVFVDQSPRLTDIIDEANKYSSNFISEMLVKAIGATVKTPANFSDGLARIRTFLERNVGLAPGEYVLGNGSGLNDTNRFSANQLMKVLEYAAGNFEIASEFISSLSVAGTQGTLSKRLKDSFMQRSLRAKTGTLTGVSSLSGYLAGDKDEVFAFAMIFENHQTSARRVTQIQDEISRKIAKEFRVIDRTLLDSDHENDYESDLSDDDETLQGGG